MVRRNTRARGVGRVAECRRQGKRHLAEMLETAQQQGRSNVQKRRLLGKFSRQTHKKKLAKLRKHNCTKQRLVENERRDRTLQRNSRRLKMLTWNLRGWGAQYSQHDIVAKTQSLLDQTQPSRCWFGRPDRYQVSISWYSGIPDSRSDMDGFVYRSCGVCSDI